MSPRIELVEYTPQTLHLTRDDYDALLADSARRISITPTVTPGEYELNPNQFVGIMRMPSGITLDFLPKVDLFNVMWMISEVERLTGIDYTRLQSQVTIRTFDDILEPIARAFVEQVEILIERGLYRTYIEQEDNLSTIRGRIDFREDVNRNVVLRHRTWCRFTEYSWDVPENQVIRQVVRKLAGWGFSTRLTGRLLSLDRQLEDVQRSHMTAADIDLFHYSRQSEHYRPIHRFCRLFLDGFSLSEHTGESSFDGFLIDMNVLFERFVAVMLDQQLVGDRAVYSLQTQYSQPLDHDRRLQVRPDLIIEHSHQPVIVADTKYKKLLTNDHKVGDIYQLITYCTVLQLTRGMLIYPRHLSDINQTLRIRGSTIEIEEVSIDLNHSRDAIATAFAALIQRMLPLVPNAITISGLAAR